MRLPIHGFDGLLLAHPLVEFHDLIDLILKDRCNHADLLKQGVVLVLSNVVSHAFESSHLLVNSLNFLLSVHCCDLTRDMFLLLLVEIAYQVLLLGWIEWHAFLACVRKVLLVTDQFSVLLVLL